MRGGHAGVWYAPLATTQRSTVPISPAEAALAIVVIALASAFQGAVGFGAALLAAPALMLIHPAFAPGPILVSNLVLTLLVARRDWSSARFHDLKFIVGGRIAGTVVAAGLLVNLSQTLFDLLFGSLVLAAVGLCLIRGDFDRSGRNLTIAGAASGLMGTLSSIGGPPVAIIYQGVNPAGFRATLSLNLVAGATVSIPALWLVGRFGPIELALSAILVPAAAFGFWLSRFGLTWVDVERVRASVLVLSTLAAVLVLWRAVSAVSS